MTVNARGFYKAIKTPKPLNPEWIKAQFTEVREKTIQEMKKAWSDYIYKFIPESLEKKKGLDDYRTNPYALMTTISQRRIDDTDDLAKFLIDNKLYMGLETSFGKAIEIVPMGFYPIKGDSKWEDPLEKINEHSQLDGLEQEAKAQARKESVWREIDKSCVIGNTRFLLTIKSGPATINDTQVQAMKDAIAKHYVTWLNQTKENYTEVEKLDIIIGLTYGTENSTNNKENQILVKLLKEGFYEVDRKTNPGVIIDSDTDSVRVYRKVGIDFWSFVGNPVSPNGAEHVFLEVLMSLASALSDNEGKKSLEDIVNRKIKELSFAISKLTFPRDSLPDWTGELMSADAVFWLSTALTLYFDTTKESKLVQKELDFS